MEKIDFKTTKEKKEGLKLAAKKMKVPVSYIMNQLVTDYLSGDVKIANRKQVSYLLVNALNVTKYLEESKYKDVIIYCLEELQCQIL